MRCENEVQCEILDGLDPFTNMDITGIIGECKIWSVDQMMVLCNLDDFHGHNYGFVECPYLQKLLSKLVGVIGYHVGYLLSSGSEK